MQILAHLKGQNVRERQRFAEYRGAPERGYGADRGHVRGLRHELFYSRNGGRRNARPELSRSPGTPARPVRHVQFACARPLRNPLARLEKPRRRRERKAAGAGRISDIIPHFARNTGGLYKGVIM